MHRARQVIKGVTGPKGQAFAGWLLTKNAAPISVASRTYNVPAAAEPFLNGSSATYVEDMYNAWLVDPSSVHAVSSNIQFFK